MNMKAAASLTGSLLARKGAAYPAAYSAPTPSPENPEAESDTSSTARAYNDPRVIASAPPAAATPAAATPAAVSNPAPQQDKQLQDNRFAASPTASPEPAADSATPTQVQANSDALDGAGLPPTMDKMGRVRLSVRLDPDRYLRVKMASARTRWSAQDIVIAALDRFLSGKSKSEDSGGDDNDDGGSQGNLN